MTQRPPQRARPVGRQPEIPLAYRQAAGIGRLRRDIADQLGNPVFRRLGDLNQRQPIGDLVDNPTQEQVIASGFNRNHVTSDEGGAIEDEYLLMYAVDRTNTLGTVFLGLTVGCAQCHDHKFDPISTEEYYGLLAFFNNNEEPGVYSQVPDPYRAMEPAYDILKPQDREKMDELETYLARMIEERDTPSSDEADGIRRFEETLRSEGHWNWERPTVNAASSSQAWAKCHWLLFAAEGAWRWVDRPREGPLEKLRRAPDRHESWPRVCPLWVRARLGSGPAELP